MNNNKFPKENNLEWLRLIFAVQVVFDHASKHMGWPITDAIHYFPGVPAFFFVSGFLIYASYLNTDVKNYFYNRFLRLFPGLVFVSLGGLLVVWVAHGSKLFFEQSNVNLTWFLAQITLGQSFNPAIFRDVGVGVINGSLWTITVEILFYVSIPFVVWLERKNKFSLYLLFLISFIIYSFGPDVLGGNIYRDKSIYDALALTPIPWGWMFISGILAFKHFEVVAKYLKYTPALIFPLLLLIFIDAGGNPVWGFSGNRLGFVYFFLYVSFILYFSFALPYKKLNFDISYGTYIWHMPVINIFLVLNFNNPLIAVFITIGISLISWFFIEKKFLKMKKKTIKF